MEPDDDDAKLAKAAAKPTSDATNAASDADAASRAAESKQLPTQQLARIALVLLHALPFTLFLLIVGLGIWRLQEVLTPIFLAFIIAYVLDPLVDRLEARKIPRAIGIVLVMLAFVLAVAGFLLFVIPSLVEDIIRVAKDAPRRLAGIVISIEPWLRARGIDVPHSVEEAITRFGGQLQEAAPGALGGATQVLQTAGRGTLSFISGVGNVVVVMVITFYLLLDFDVIVSAANGLVPHRYKPTVAGVMDEVDRTLAQWIRGQLTVMLILAVLYSVGFSVAGIRLAVGIGIIAGVLSFIPYFGTGVGLVLAVLMALVDWQGPLPLILVIAVVAGVQVLDGLVITPRIVGGKVGLGPAWIIIALMTGGNLFGFLGVLVAVPSAAVIKIMVYRAIAYYRTTETYREGAAPGALEAEARVIAASSHPTPTPDAVVDAASAEPQKPYSALTSQLEAAARVAEASATASASALTPALSPAGESGTGPDTNASTTTSALTPALSPAGERGTGPDTDASTTTDARATDTKTDEKESG